MAAAQASQQLFWKHLLSAESSADIISHAIALAFDLCEVRRSPCLAHNRATVTPLFVRFV